MRSYLRNSWRVLLKEVSAFGLIGAVAFAIDLGVFAWLSPHGAIKANIVSTTLSTTFAYFGNRYFSALCIAVFVYPLHYAHGSKTVFIVKIVTIGIGTIFRFWAYKRFVFLHPDRVHAHGIDVDQELAE
jgi:putative flippase GtrA